MGPVVASAIEQRSLSALIPYAKTARTHSPTQVSQILANPSNRPRIDTKNAIPRPVFDVHLSTISAICRVSRRLARTPHRGARTPGRKAADDRWRQPAHRSPVESYHRALSPIFARLAFVRRARELGFTLDEVRTLLTLAATDGDSTCAQVREVVAGHLAEVRTKVADLRAMERVLVDAVRRCDAGEAPGCPLIDTLSGSLRP
jgi:MerR, DNA binding